MMGLGYLGSSSSSSSSSSNLSPLAPPFTVDRSNHNKPVLNSNSISHLNDSSYGVVPFTSSWPYSHSSSARQNFLADSPGTTTLPLNDSGYMIPEPVNHSTAGNWSGLSTNGKHGLEQITPGRSHWSGVYPSPKRLTDSFSYNLSEAKPFYPPYASSVNNDDIPLVTFSEPSYDLLSTSGLGQGQGDEVDYTRSLSGLEYNLNHPQQDSVWSRLPLAEGNQVKKIETDDSFFSEEANLAAASLAYNNYLNQGAYGTKTSSKSKDDSSLFYYADIIRRANNTGPSSNGKSDGGTSSFSAKGGSTFRAFPMFSESHPLIQSPEPPSEDLWNSQNSYNPYEKRYHMFDSSDDHMSITKPSTLVIKPPAAAVSSSTFSASKSLDIGDDLSALNINDVMGSHKPLKEKEQSSSIGSFLAPTQLSFQIGRTDASTKEDQMSISACNDQLNFEFKARSNFQVPEINIPNVNTTENVKITANSFEQFDHHNPAEDSPCWKGAPTSQFLPFEAESPQPPMKKQQTGNGVDLQTDCSFKNSSGADETDEKTSGPILIVKEHAVEAVDAGAGSLKASNGGVRSVNDDTIKPKKEHGEFISTSDANSQTPKLKLPIPAEMDEMKIQLLHGDGAKNVNLSGVVKSLYNLSDLLLLHCSNDEFALKEHDLESLDHVIRNLGVCMSREVQLEKSSKEVMNGNNEEYGKAKCDSFGKNVEKLVEHASLRVEADADPAMVQAIKKVLDESLECKVELPSETLLYKDLWLEAEAELCSLSFRARFQRLKKRDTTHKSKDGAVKKEISRSCNDPKIPSNPKVPVDDSVMARFNILKRRQEPNPQVKVPQVSVVGNGNGNDIDPWVMERLSILKRRGELNANDAEEKEVRDCGKEGPMGGHFQDEEEEEEEEAVGSGGSDWEHILKDEFSWRLT